MGCVCILNINALPTFQGGAVSRIKFGLNVFLVSRCMNLTLLGCETESIILF